MTAPSQNFIISTSEVSHPMPFRMPISVFSSALSPVALSHAKMKKARKAPANRTMMYPARQSKREV